MVTSALEEKLLLQIRLAGLPEPEREQRFHPVRKWRADFMWRRQQLIVEVEGGTWQVGRHQRPEGFERDCRKYNEAALRNWKVLRFTRAMIESGEALAQIMRGLAGSPPVTNPVTD